MTTETDPSDESPWYEYLQSDLFWVLTILIISTSIWSEGQHNLLIRKSEGQEDTQSSEAPPQPASGINLKDQITSRLRQYLAVLLCVSPIPGELIHGLLDFVAIYGNSNPMSNLLFFQNVKRKFDKDEIWEGEPEGEL
ncbi:hypothetical protein CEK25_002321 [Fusarium fujikuroi]|nr:hypothetical protein CEK25_002321 [Fusarium fujikuroi]